MLWWILFVNQIDHVTRLFGWLVALRPMCSPPPRLLIESLLLPLNTVPALVVRSVIRTERFDDVRCFAIATFAAMRYEVFNAHDLIYRVAIMSFCRMNANPASTYNKNQSTNSHETSTQPNYLFVWVRGSCYLPRKRIYRRHRPILTFKNSAI